MNIILHFKIKKLSYYTYVKEKYFCIIFRTSQVHFISPLLVQNENCKRNEFDTFVGQFGFGKSWAFIVKTENDELFFGMTTTGYI